MDEELASLDTQAVKDAQETCANLLMAFACRYIGDPPRLDPHSICWLHLPDGGGPVRVTVGQAELLFQTSGMQQLCGAATREASVAKVQDGVFPVFYAGVPVALEINSPDETLRCEKADDARAMQAFGVDLEGVEEDV